MSTVADKLLTIDEYLRLPDNGRPTELVQGRIVQMNPPLPRHGYLCNRLGRLLGDFAEGRRLGRVFNNDSGVVTHRDPDSLRGPDVAYYSFARVPEGPLPETYLEAAPEIVIEVRSPSDRWPALLAKAAEYLQAGVLCVCLVDPDRGVVEVVTEQSGVTKLGPADDLTFPDILPGFRVRVGELLDL